MCLPRQLSRVLDRDLHIVCQQFDELQAKVYPDVSESPYGKESWRGQGLCMRMLKAYCAEENLPCLLMHGTRRYDRYTPKQHHTAVPDLPPSGAVHAR